MNRSVERIRVEMAELYPAMEERLRVGGEVIFTPNGGSMRPFWRSGRHSVKLTRPGGKAPQDAFADYRVGDVLFYRRNNGQFVLHRLMRLDGGLPVFCGDAGTELEYGVAPEAVLARVVGFWSGGRYVDCRTSRRYRWAVRIWMALFPIRGALIRGGRRMKRLFFR